MTSALIPARRFAGWTRSSAVLAAPIIALGLMAAAPPAQAQFFDGGWVTRPFVRLWGDDALLSGRELGAVLASHGIRQSGPADVHGDVIVVHGYDRRGVPVRALIDAHDGTMVDLAYAEAAPVIIDAPRHVRHSARHHVHPHARAHAAVQPHPRAETRQAATVQHVPATGSGTAAHMQAASQVKPAPTVVAAPVTLDLPPPPPVPDTVSIN